MTKRVDELKNLGENADSTRHDNSETNREVDKRSIIVKNLEKRNESTLDAIDRLIKNGLRLKTINIVSFDGWESRNEGPRTILVVLQTVDQKKEVISKKNTLTSTRRYENVYIEPVVSAQQRLVNANFRRIIKNLGENNLCLRVSRVYNTDSGTSEDMSKVRIAEGR